MLHSDLDRIKSPGFECLEPLGAVVGEGRSEQKRVDAESHERILPGDLVVEACLLETRYLTIKARLGAKAFLGGK